MGVNRFIFAFLAVLAFGTLADEIALRLTAQDKAILAQETRLCEAFAKPEEQKQCFVEHLGVHARGVRFRYADSIQQTHPVIRRAVGLGCKDAGDFIVRRTQCYRDAYIQIVADLAQLKQLRHDDNSASDLQRQLVANNHFFGKLAHDACGGNVSASCFDRTLAQMHSQMSHASRDMSQAFERLARWSALAYQCNRVSHDEDACERSEYWKDALFPRVDEIAYEPASGTAVLSSDPNAAPSLRTGGSDERWADGFVACRYGFTAQPADTRNWAPSQIERALRGNELESFLPEISTLLPRAEVTHYFELLRMEAAARLLKAHRRLVDKEISYIPAECSPLREGIERFAALPRSEADQQAVAAVKSIEYLREAHDAALTIVRLQGVARQAASVRKMDCHHDGLAQECSIRPEWAEAQERLHAAESAIVELTAAFPILGAGHSPTSEIYESLPGARRFSEAMTDQALQVARAQSLPALSSDLGSALKAFCSPSDKSGVPWQQLILLGLIREPVLETFPQFKTFQSCALDVLERENRARFISQLFFGAGCFVGSVATSGAMGPVCTGLFLVGSLHQLNVAKNALAVRTECRAAGDTVCSEADLRAARADYDAAVTKLTITVVAGVFDLPALARDLRVVANFLRPSQLRALAARISAAGDLEKLAALRAETTQLLHSAGGAAH